MKYYRDIVVVKKYNFIPTSTKYCNKYNVVRNKIQNKAHIAKTT